MNEIVEAMARTLHVLSWIDREEEEGRFYPGAELMDIAPPTPQEAYDAAWRLWGRIEQINGLDIYTLFVRALVADKQLTYQYSSEEFDAALKKWSREFGHCLAMQSLGHGVSWFDDHEYFNLKTPVFEYMP